MNEIFEPGDVAPTQSQTGDGAGHRGKAHKGRDRRSVRAWGLWLALGLVFVLALAACGRSADENGASPRAQRVIPTMPAARFAQPTTQIGGRAAEADEVEADEAEVEEANGEPEADEPDVDEETTPEPVEEAEDVAEAEETPAPEPTVDLERGANIYQTRGCHECHGEQAQGIPGEGSALAGLSMNEREFTSVLRTGGGGQLGSGHLYGPSTISPGGMSALHAWLESLDAE